MTALWVSLLSILATAAGGLCALGLRGRLDRVLGFTAGAVLGLVCFELLPEILELAEAAGADGRLAMAAMACGFVAVHAIQRRPDAHRHLRTSCGHRHDGRSASGTAYAAALI